ncbi:MAG: transporter substrate-binding protein [Ramlibacter sp.]|nr:transporter substrate-binding protein [Ramlibacter sp.]
MRRWLLLALCALAIHAHAVQVVDDRGVAVDVPAPPQRIVSMLPSLTETVCELGRCAGLVGVDDYSNWPASVRGLPRLGGLEDANIERIVALKPDLVMLSVTSRAVGRLEGLGIKVVGLEVKTMADVRRALVKVGQFLDRAAEAEQVWARINAGIDEAARGLPPVLRGTTVYFEVGEGPYAASEISHIGEVLARVGAANIVPGALGSVPKLNPEFVVRANPQVIMISEFGARTLKQRPGWSRIRAVRDGRVCALNSVQGDVLVRPGPRLAEAARIMVDCLKAPAKGAS